MRAFEERLPVCGRAVPLAKVALLRKCVGLGSVEWARICTCAGDEVLMRPFDSDNPSTRGPPNAVLDLEERAGVGLSDCAANAAIAAVR